MAFKFLGTSLPKAPSSLSATSPLSPPRSTLQTGTLASMRAHEAFWKFAAEHVHADHLRARHSFCDGHCRKKRDSQWLSTPPGKDARDLWEALTDDDRARLMVATADPAWPAYDDFGVIDGRLERKMKRRRVRNAPPPASTSAPPSTFMIKCTVCSQRFATPEEEPSAPAAHADPQTDPETDLEHVVVDDDCEDDQVGGDLGGLDEPATDGGELAPMRVLKLLVENGVPLNLASDSMVAACFPAKALPSEGAEIDRLVGEWYNQLRSEAVEGLRAQKHVVLSVVTDFGGTGGFAKARGGRVTVLLSAPRAPRPIYWTSFPMVPASTDSHHAPRTGGTSFADQIDSVVADASQLLGKDSSIVATITGGSEIDLSMTGLASNRSLLVAGSALTYVVRALIRDAIRVARTHEGEASMVERVLQQAARLSAFISQHQLLLQRMRSPKPKLPIMALVREGLLDQSFYNVVAYRSDILSAFKDCKPLDQAKGLEDIRAVAMDAGFWRNAELLVQILDPMAACLGEVDSSNGALSHSYRSLLTLRAHAVYSNPIDGLPAGIQSAIHNLVEENWGKLRMNGLVSVAFLLDPHFGVGEFDGYDCDSAILNAVRLVGEGGGFVDSGARDKYKATLERFTAEKARLRASARGYSAYQWWRGAFLFPSLQDLALKVFSVPTGARAMEEAHREAKTTRKMYQSSKLDAYTLEKLVFIRNQLSNKPDAKTDSDDDDDDLDEEEVAAV